LAWLFPPPKLIVNAILHLKKCRSEALLLVPQWQHSHFYPFLLEQNSLGSVKKMIIYPGGTVFLAGADKDSYFGPNFRGYVEVWHLNYKN